MCDEHLCMARWRILSHHQFPSLLSSLWLSQYVFFEKVSLTEWILVSNVVESCLLTEMIPVPSVGESGIISDSSEFLPGLFVLKCLSSGRGTSWGDSQQ